MNKLLVDHQRTAPVAGVYRFASLGFASQKTNQVSSFIIIFIGWAEVIWCIVLQVVFSILVFGDIC